SDEVSRRGRGVSLGGSVGFAVVRGRHRHGNEVWTRKESRKFPRGRGLLARSKKIVLRFRVTWRRTLVSGTIWPMRPTLPAAVVSLGTALLLVSRSPGALAEAPDEHQGLYVRAALGFAYFSDAVKSDTFKLGAASGDAEGTITGTGIPAELAVGWSVTP